MPKGVHAHNQRGIDMTLVTAYVSHHRKIRRARGRARDFVCPCGRQALDWAYQHKAVVEIIFPTGQVGSMDFDDYIPMCRSCHNTMDVRKTYA